MLDTAQEKREAYARELQANAGELRRQIVESRRAAKRADAEADVPDYGFLHEEADYLPDANAYERAVSDIANEARALGASWDEVFSIIDNHNSLQDMLAGFEQLRGKYDNQRAASDAGTTQRPDTQTAGTVAKPAPVPKPTQKSEPPAPPSTDKPAMP